MRVHLITVGQRMPDWVETAFSDYAGRLPHEVRLTLVEIAPPPRGKSPDLARLKRQEADKILRALPRDAEVIALDERGQMLDTVGWSAALTRWLPSGRDAVLIIGVQTERSYRPAAPAGRAGPRGDPVARPGPCGRTHGQPRSLHR